MNQIVSERLMNEARFIRDSCIVFSADRDQQCNAYQRIGQLGFLSKQTRLQRLDPQKALELAGLV